MADSTLIAWTDHTANFWLGCVKVSDGCKHCYAETLVKNRMGKHHLWGPAKTTQRQAVKGVYANIRKWEREAASGVPASRGAGLPHLVFVGSLMDWAEDHPDADAVRPGMWAAIRESPHLHFQMLTKRPERIASLLPPDWGEGGYSNVWLGTSVEDMRVADRVDHLRKIPAVVRFISAEPLIGPLNDLDLTGIDWLITGGESGPGFRSLDWDWVRALRRKCDAQGTAFFHKQGAAPRTEMFTTLDGETVRDYPVPRPGNQVLEAALL